MATHRNLSRFAIHPASDRQVKTVIASHTSPESAAHLLAGFAADHSGHP